jgi:hypothetical protein
MLQYSLQSLDFRRLAHVLDRGGHLSLLTPVERAARRYFDYMVP